LAAESAKGERQAAANAAGTAEGVVTRRGLLRLAMWGSLLLGLAQLFGGFINFFWPRKVGAFGGPITVGNVNDFEVGSITKVADGKFYLSRVEEGFLALYWRCTTWAARCHGLRRKVSSTAPATAPSLTGAESMWAGRHPGRWT